MWFQMPKGCNGISVELQSFAPEIKDEDGNAYFRAPDHFAPRILALGGFSILESIPEGFPADLPKADPLRDGAIAELTKRQAAQDIEIQNLREDLNVATARVAALSNEKAGLLVSLQEKTNLITSLEEQLEDKPQETKKAK